jgi:hypothetical protein
MYAGRGEHLEELAACDLWSTADATSLLFRLKTKLLGRFSTWNRFAAWESGSSRTGAR